MTNEAMKGSLVLFATNGLIKCVGVCMMFFAVAISVEASSRRRRRFDTDFGREGDDAATTSPSVFAHPYCWLSKSPNRNNSSPRALLLISVTLYFSCVDWGEYQTNGLICQGKQALPFLGNLAS